jgi:hypothetical protein
MVSLNVQYMGMMNFGSFVNKISLGSFRNTEHNEQQNMIEFWETIM